MSKIDPEKLKSYTRQDGTPFRIQKIGHVVLNVTDMDRSVKFYTEVLGMKVSDVYKEDMMPGGMVFMRFSADHHGVALVGGGLRNRPGRCACGDAGRRAALRRACRPRRRNG